MVARRHHFLPQCYLKSFAVPRKRNTPKVRVFDRTNHRTFEAGIDNIGLERDFNRVDLEGIDLDAFEKAISGFESDLAPALKRIIQAGTLENPDDRATLLNFIGLLFMRNPRLRERTRDFHERTAKAIMSLALSTRERWESQVRQAKAAGYMKDADTDYEKMKSFFEKGEYNIEVSTNRHIALEMGTFDRILPLLFERRWVIIRASPECAGFITSHHPVCLIWSEPRGRIPIGLGLRGTEVVFPISPRLAVLGAYEIEEGDADATPLLVAEMNGTIALFAERHVYARDMNFAYSLDEKEGPRKAKALVDDRRFTRLRVP
jgi:hypothetical protein